MTTRRRLHRVLHLLPDLAVGGGQQVVLQTVTHLDPNRFSSYVAFFRDRRGMDERFHDARVSPVELGHRRFWSLPAVLIRLVRLIRRSRIDLIHVQGTALDRLYGEAAAYLTGIPVVRTLHGQRGSRTLRPAGWSRPRQWVQRVVHAIKDLLDAWLEPRTVRWAVAVSDPAHASWKLYWQSRRLPRECLTVNYNGTELDDAPDLTPEQVREVRAELGAADADPLLICVSRLERGKNQSMLVAAMRELRRDLPRAQLLIVGDGAERDVVRAAVAQSGLDGCVHVLGQRLDVARLLACSDVFVFPAVYAFEGFPLVVLEAMASGLPVVAFDVSVLHPLRGAGVDLVDLHTPEALAAAVKQVAMDPEVRRHKGQLACESVRRYDIKNSVRNLERIYDAVLSGAGRTQTGVMDPDTTGVRSKAG